MSSLAGYLFELFCAAWIGSMVCFIGYRWLRRKGQVVSIPQEEDTSAKEISEPVLTLARRLEDGLATFEDKVLDSCVSWRGSALGHFNIFEIEDKDVDLSLILIRSECPVPRKTYTGSDTYWHLDNAALSFSENRAYQIEHERLSSQIEDIQFWLTFDEKNYLTKVCKRLLSVRQATEMKERVEKARAESKKREEEFENKVNEERNSFIKKYETLYNKTDD